MLASHKRPDFVCEEMEEELGKIIAKEKRQSLVHRYNKHKIVNDSVSAWMSGLSEKQRMRIRYFDVVKKTQYHCYLVRLAWERLDPYWCVKLLNENGLQILDPEKEETERIEMQLKLEQQREIEEVLGKNYNKFRGVKQTQTEEVVSAETFVNSLGVTDTNSIRVMDLTGIEPPDWWTAGRQGPNSGQYVNPLRFSTLVKDHVFVLFNEYSKLNLGKRRYIPLPKVNADDSDD